MRLPKSLIAIGFSASLLGADPAHAIFGFAKKNCYGCHNKANPSGDVDLASSQTPRDLDTHRETWERVLLRVKSGEMPPATVPRPPAPERDALIRSLEQEFDRQDRNAKPDPGRVTARRLNRSEYSNTVRDLLGVDIQPTESFPQDEAAYGFDNIADALTLSPVLLEKYLQAAERVVRTAIFGPEKLKPAYTHYPSPVRIPVLPKDLFHYDTTGLSTHHATHVVHRFPVDGEYSIRFTLNGHRPQGSNPVTPALFIDGKLIRGWKEEGEDLEGRIVETRTFVRAGERLVSASYLNVYEGLPPKYNGPNPSNPEAVPTLSSPRGQLTERDIELLRKYGTKLKTDRAEVRVDNRFESMDIGGPFTQQLGPTTLSTAKIFTCRQQTPACAQSIVSSFARNAFRRPLRPGEAAPFLKIYSLARNSGDSFAEGIAAALEAILVSPHFLFRIEQDRPPLPGKDYAPVGDYELATRLSYFLWSTTPDPTLLRLASLRTLRQPATLRAQIRRMLQDQRSRALVENFAGQWLQYRNIDAMKPDVEKFPDFDESLRHAMKQETTLFLLDLVRNNGRVTDVLSASHTFLNERMARFYGIPGVVGPEFRRVDMSAARRGGGILAHASMLTTSSYSTRTSPVLRGRWILENLLNAPPPPPPPAVPPLEEAKGDGSLTLRMQMEAHRKNPACAGCHGRMDPLGFGLENFDAIGKWRDLDGLTPVDASGTLPGAGKFNGPGELKQLLLDGRQPFLRGLTEKLLIYALGRGLERADKPVVNRIAAKLPNSDYRFAALVEEIINSLPFQMRRSGGQS
jgi:hypothetical protein